MAENVVSFERVDETTVRVQITVPQVKVDEAFESAQKVVEALKARPLGEKQLGVDSEQTVARAVANRATRTVVEAAVHDVVESSEIRLTANPEVDLKATVERGRDFSFAFEAKVVPELSLKPFNRLQVMLDRVADVTEADIDAKLEEIRARSATVQKGSKEPIGSDDLVRISFTSTLDGQEYEGNNAKDVGYQMGSFMLPKPFEDGLLGMKAGDARTIEFVVPADFDNSEIAGKVARFDVEVSDVSKVVLPDLNDEFAREFDYQNLVHFRETLKGRLAEEKAAGFQEERERRAREELANLLVGEVPESLASAQATRMLEAFKMQMKQQGVEFSEYCGYLGISEKDVLDEMREQAAQEVRENLALEALFRHEGLQVTETDKKRTAEEMALGNELSPESLFRDMNQDQRAAIREMTEHRMATEWLLEHCDFLKQ